MDCLDKCLDLFVFELDEIVEQLKIVLLRHAHYLILVRFNCLVILEEKRVGLLVDVFCDTVLLVIGEQAAQQIAILVLVSLFGLHQILGKIPHVF